MHVCGEASTSVCMLRLYEVLKPSRIVQKASTECVSLCPHSTCHWSSLHCNMWHSSANSTPYWFDKRPANRNTHSSPDAHQPTHLPPPMSNLFPSISSPALLRLFLLPLSSSYPQFTLSFKPHAISFSILRACFWVFLHNLERHCQPVKLWMRRFFFMSVKGQR